MEFEPLSMANEVIEFDMMGLGDIEHPVQEYELLRNSPAAASLAVVPPGIVASSTEPLIPEGDTNLEPYEGMEFESEEAAKAFYNSYARRVGFSTRVSMSRRSRRDGAIIQRSFVCAKEGFRVDKHDKQPVPDRDGRVKRPRAETRVGCKAMLAVKIQDSGRWVVSAFVKEHNHELVPPDKVHCLRSHRHVSGAAKSLIDTLQSAGIGPSGIMSALIKEYGGISNVGFTERDCRNYMRSSRQRTLGGDTQHLLDYLRSKQAENPAFFYAVQGDEDQCMSNIFWADPKARTNYTYFGDTVTFDTTYRSNRYRLPFAPFTGVNHHGQPVLFGCALLINESESSFVWLFETWLAAMSGRSPVSITTDHDRVIRLAVTQVFPESRHRFCKWHIFKECQEKLSHVLSEHPSFEAELHKCVNLTESVEEFESCWLSIIDRYDLREHEWLQSVYSNRRQWVPVYLRDAFFAEMSITQRSDSMNSYFDGYVNASTTLQLFVKQYEKALESRYEKEVKADYDTINTAPVLKTPSPMEKQAAEFYTRKLFMKFQEELVETLTFLASKVEVEEETSTYQVAKFGESHKAYFVRFNVQEMKVNCSCQMFEFSGLLCRHILTVFRVTNVLTLPSRYILKRWTRNAKSGVVLEERASDLLNSSRESLTVRYNNLRQEALKYVDEGVKTVEIYNVAVRALQEAANKVAMVMKNGLKNVTVNGTAREDLFYQGSEVTNTLAEDEQDRKIHKLSRQLERSRRKCTVYRANLLSVLKDIEEQKLQLSVKVQNIKLGMKE
ncbi:protein FAR1-RELATED SEQUENCE 5 [Ziziphus jujuba]|uniref:Protein FAR1-RELATED SEQUENCE n=1 Tax=Ziziphus jujuba TaxID=326968 RepID=A0A6P4ATT1_ZIZJJ|nr:protein FAR1-RELATED SEQUENCE 5 [Ziziphus jujuba]XP_048335209.2 protein FAR1-RELATED SEQUENCE 5 [Ziziphus jujuba]XP_048335211.1 protein FAR1-RELATED SEQUENCE 5 [Ziziphus jujuba]XP_060674820.1 protein FAR1-RELATED SEQUENCE 5 [Ziziphus jujuba]